MDFYRQNLLEHLSFIKSRLNEITCPEEDREYLLGLIGDVEDGKNPNWVEETEDKK